MTETPSIFVRHPRLTVLGVLATGTLFVLVLLEIGLRLFGSLNINYYTGTRTPGLHRYPYGDVPINAEGFPDEEFNLADTKRRVGYLGDSVTFGVGAGYGYRVPDLLQQRMPELDHWVFANVGERLEERTLIRQVDRFKLDTVVYLMNLNDIVPDAGTAEAANWVTEARGGVVGGFDGFLRGRSYLYTYVRLGLKNAMQRAGYEGATGLQAFELFPQQNEAVIAASADRVAAAFRAAAGARPVRGCVVLLPYEMQVSADAAKTYREMGFKWEAGFDEVSTQKRLIAAFAKLDIPVFDAREAFAGQTLKVGETFVYDRGDKVDWNHPNRKGHQLIADWLVNQTDLASRCLDPTRKQ